MAYQSVVYRIINSLTSDCNICPLIVHKNREMNWGEVLVTVKEAAALLLTSVGPGIYRWSAVRRL